MFSLIVNLKKIFITIELKNCKILKQNNMEKFLSLTYRHFKIYSIFEEYEVIIRFLIGIIFEHSSRKTRPKNYIFSQFYELFFLEYTEILKIFFRILYFSPIKYLGRNKNLKNNPNKISKSIKNTCVKLSLIKKNKFFLPIFIYCFYIPAQHFPIYRLELNQKNIVTNIQKGRQNLDVMEKALLFLKLSYRQNGNSSISDIKTRTGYGKVERKLFPIDNINMINFIYSKKIKFFSKKNNIFFVLALFFLEFFKDFKQFFGGSFTQFKPILKRGYNPVNLDTQFNMFGFFWTTRLSRTKDRRPILKSLLKFTQSKKIISGEKTFFNFLEKGYIYLRMLKYNHQKKLLFFFHDLENIFGRYGKKTFYWFLKKSNLKFLTPTNFLSDFIILETLKYFGIIYNLRASLKIRDFKNFSNPSANNIFIGNYFVYNGMKKFFNLNGSAFSNLKTKRESKYTKFAIWANLILGKSGKIEQFLFFSLKILKKWDFTNRKLFWKNWLLREILQTAKKSRNKLLSIRCKYFFLTKANLFYENFFK